MRTTMNFKRHLRVTDWWLPKVTNHNIGRSREGRTATRQVMTLQLITMLIDSDCKAGAGG